jgi:Mn-dependent DtxR family transcriptional regulator
MDDIQLWIRDMERTFNLLRASPDAEYLYLALPANGKLTQAKLADVIGAKPSHVRKLMRELRRAGYAVCSDNKGCWKTTKPHEINRTIKHLEGRALSLLRTASAMKKRMRIA